MKKTFFLVIFILLFIFSKNSNANNINTLRNACIASKMANHGVTIGGTALAIPSIYYLAKYLNKKAFPEEKNQRFLSKNFNKFLYVTGNITLTVIGLSLVAYGLNKADASGNLLKMLGYSPIASKACDYIIWPNFKYEFTEKLFSY